MLYYIYIVNNNIYDCIIVIVVNIAQNYHLILFLLFFKLFL